MTATLYPFQEQAVQELLDGKHIVRIDTGGGKTAVMFNWLKRVDAKKILIIAVPSKIKSGDFIKDAELFCGKGWAEQRHIEYVSWYKLADWASKHVLDENEYYVAADECVPANTKVMTDSGEKDIDTIKVGDKVLSYNHEMGACEYKRVTRTIKKIAPSAMYRLTMQDGTAIISTGNHPHYTQDGYKNAEDIKVGDTLQEKGRQIKGTRVASVEVLKLRDIKKCGLYREADFVYCIDVEDNHNFFANGLLTHNCHMSKAGVSSKRGKAFLNIAKRCKGWTGYTATPGDAWIDFYPYFVASGKFRTKTYFLQNFCNRQTYPFPKIVSYCNTDTLNEWWKEIATIPDTTEVFAQLPKATHQQVHFKKPKGYDKVMKECKTLDGEPLESNMAMAHYLRQLCDTKDKQEWLEDFLSSLSSSLVLFYNYACERENILKICQKLKRKVWRIDGQKHEIPTPETIGKNDVVLVHYASGSASLNLQFMNYWLSYSPNYSYTTSTQARGRIRRIGQERPQFFYYFRTDKTIEDAVFKALASKKDFAADIWLADNGVNLDKEEN